MPGTACKCRLLLLYIILHTLEKERKKNNDNINNCYKQQLYCTLSAAAAAAAVGTVPAHQHKPGWRQHNHINTSKNTCSIKFSTNTATTHKHLAAQVFTNNGEAEEVLPSLVLLYVTTTGIINVDDDGS